jgi:signal transduction histidine kinase
LVAAFLIPTLLLGWIGLDSLRQETRRGADRYRAQAEVLAQKVAAELAKVPDELKSGTSASKPLDLRFASDGAWLGETFAARALAPSGDQALFTLLSDEVDRYQAQGDGESASARLEDAAAKNNDGELTAWALDTRAVFLDQLGRVDEARAVRRDLIARFPLARNSRGLLRSFAARLALIDGESDPLQAQIELCGDAAEDYTSLDQTATAEFLRRLREQLAAEIDASNVHYAALEAVDRADAARARLRVWLASMRQGATDWIARGAPEDARTFPAAEGAIPSANPLSMEAPRDRARAGAGEFIAAVERDGAEWSGGALELASVFDRALEVARADGTTASFGFTLAVEPREAPIADSLARIELGRPFHEFTISVRGGDLAAFMAGERRRFALIAGLLALTILTAATAAWLSLRAIAREVEAARGREAFVAAVTHELKTPLAAIRLFAEMLEHGDVEPLKVREFGARTVQESDRLARLVDSVLDLARIEHAGTLAAKSRVDLCAVAGAATLIVEGVAKERGFELALNAAPEKIFVNGDGDALTRAIVNLLDNALKYSDQPHRIDVGIFRRTDGFAEVAVEDRGRGVPEAERERIFEAFRRVGSEMTRDRPGIGLGLALVARIAAAHGGRATCEAREGGGSRFALTLPLADGVTA